MVVPLARCASVQLITGRVVAIDLVTGVPGAGKTLYTVSKLVAPMVGRTIEHEGKTVPRRLMIGGIRDLLLPHELVYVPEVNPESYRDEWTDVDREPGEPAVLFTHWLSIERDGRAARIREACGADTIGAEPLPIRADNWWLWAEPGDVIVIDECQRCFRPMSSGRRVPGYVARLERHRHYGIDFIVITQHPQLLHTNVRNLVGRHRHVRRLFGRSQTLVYEWDHCSNPDRYKNATTTRWPHDKNAFKLYKSAEVHTKHSHTLPLPLLVGLAAIVALPVTGWYAYQRVKEGGEAKLSGQRAASAPSSSASGVAASGSVPGQAAAPRAGAPAPRTAAWPVLETGTVDLKADPYTGRGVHLLGGYTVNGVASLIFVITVNGRAVSYPRLDALQAAGYLWRELAPCSGVLSFQGRYRLVTCDAPVADAPPRVEPAKSAESAS